MKGEEVSTFLPEPGRMRAMCLGAKDPFRACTGCFRWISHIGGSVSPVETGYIVT